MHILFENDDLLVLNKPSGIMVHADGKQDQKTLADLILESYPELESVGEPLLINGATIARPGIVHRLDEETSGALIVAKTQEAFLFLKEQFKNREVAKEYHAFVWGHFKEERGFVDAPIGRSTGDFRRWQSGRGIRGETREAYTAWKRISSFTDEVEEPFSYLHLFPKTGRTHQLRVHLKYLQRPIVSDSLYAPTKRHALGFERLALHARKITFTLLSGELVTVEAPFEVDFTDALAKYVNL